MDSSFAPVKSSKSGSLLTLCDSSIFDNDFVLSGFSTNTDETSGTFTKYSLYFIVPNLKELRSEDELTYDSHHDQSFADLESKSTIFDKPFRRSLSLETLKNQKKNEISEFGMIQKLKRKSKSIESFGLIRSNSSISGISDSKTKKVPSKISSSWATVIKDTGILYTPKKSDTSISHKQSINSLNNIFSRKYSKENLETKKTELLKVFKMNQETKNLEESDTENIFQRTFLNSSENHVTVKQLVDYLTTSLAKLINVLKDQGFLVDFFMVFRNFMTSLELMEDVIQRFRYSLDDSEKMGKFIRVRIFVALRHWLTNYWDVDFHHSKHLGAKLRSFLFCTGEFESILETDIRIIQNIKDIMIIEMNKSQTNSRKCHSHLENELKNDGENKSQIPNSIFRGLKNRRMKSMSQLKFQLEIDSQNHKNLRISSSHQILKCIKSEELILKRSSKNTEVKKPTINQELVAIAISAYESKINEKNIDMKGWSNLSYTLKNLQTPHNFSLTNGFRSFILDYDSDDIAKQFCLLEQKLIRQVPWMQLLDVEIWTQKRNMLPIIDQPFMVSRFNQETWNSEEGIPALVNRSNLTSSWVVNEIIRTSELMSTSDCVKIVEKFIQIAQVFDRLKKRLL
ncbi:Guanine nucleotide exchange factor lte1 [Nowakowskiella sp. JEL0078]|nr:Guanine nucleotide exchange factor lte1 [Nowakowskiella sp. JEL0078]